MERLLNSWLPRPIRFALVGLSNTLVDIGAFTALVSGFEMSMILANVIGYMLGTINSYVLNRNPAYALSSAHFCE